ncbi:MAG: PocR ligand-binding domain-containing protein [Clostridia bacterium]|nr:PocR ligand-binding domain-containing protein [Clostridia bacterium]
MNSYLLHLKYMIDLEKFQKIQDDIAAVSEMALLTVDYKGVPVTEHSNCSPFCKRIRENPNYRKLCEKCDSRGGLEATRIQQPYIYLCHAGLVDFAVPIIVDEKYLGAVMAGQILLDKTAEDVKLEKIYHDPSQTIDFEKDTELMKLYRDLPVMDLRKIKTVADMMMHFTNYIVEEAIIKMSLFEFNQKVVKLIQAEEFDELEKELIRPVVNFPGITMGEAVKNFSDILRINNPEGKRNGAEKAEEAYVGSKILKPAIEYIHQNPEMKITLDQMASLCNVSSSYFSKLFKKEMRQQFSNFINEVKMSHARKLLESTDMTIYDISAALAFEDCGYFIKVFKKLVGVTPAVYRKYHNFSSN